MRDTTAVGSRKSCSELNWLRWITEPPCDAMLNQLGYSPQPRGERRDVPTAHVARAHLPDNADLGIGGKYAHSAIRRAIVNNDALNIIARLTLHLERIAR